jgi:hypothetical protein
MKFHKTLAILFFLTVSFDSLSQKVALYAGTQIPVKYDIGFEYKISRKISTNFNLGILTTPYDEAILGILEELGVSQPYIKMIGNTFKVGVVGDLGVRYHYKKNYFGIYGQNIYLFAQTTPTDQLERNLNIKISKFIAFGNRPNPQLSLKSDLWQMGVLYGRRFELKNPKYEFRTEIAVSANITSKSKLYLDNVENAKLSELIDKELKPTYKDYAYLPSLNVYFVYKFLPKNK